MIICVCNNVDEKTIKEQGCTCIKELRKKLNICDQCTMCHESIIEILKVRDED